MFKVITSLLIVLLNLAATQMGSCTMSLPDGIENILGFVPSSTFQCQRDGYFGDIDNDCKIFHLCQKQVHPNGRIEWRHWTYACGNQTMFNQLTLTCAFVDEAIPCKHASQFQYLNEVIHKPQEPFLTDADVTSGVSYYSNRIMSDGARARAFEDSRLMAQIGGGSAASPAATSSGNQREQASQHHHTRSAGLSSSTSHSANRFSDVDDTVSRTINSVELPELPLSENFQSALNAQLHQNRNQNQNRHQHPHQQQQQPSATATTTTTTANQGDDLVINHQHHFQHQQQNYQIPTAPLTATATTTSARQTPQFSGSESSGPPRVSTHHSLRQQQQLSVTPITPATQSQPQPPVDQSSFDFSISTNHRVGPASASPDAAIVVVSSQSGQQQQHQPSVVPPSASLQQRQPASGQLLSAFAALSTAAPPPTASGATDRVATFVPVLLSQQPSREPLLQPTATSTSSGGSANNRQQAVFVQRTPTLAATTPTTNSLAAAVAPAAGPLTQQGQVLSPGSITQALASPVAASQTVVSTQQVRRRQVQHSALVEQAPTRSSSGRLARQRASQQLQQQQQRNSADLRLFDQMHSAFQSNRISSLEREARGHQQPDSAIVMRRQPTQPTAAATAAASDLQGAQMAPEATTGLAASPSQSATAAPTTATTTTAPVANNQQIHHDNHAAPAAAAFTDDEPISFWRRAFDVQLMAPKFGSLLAASLDGKLRRGAKLLMASRIAMVEVAVLGLDVVAVLRVKQQRPKP